MNMVSVEEDGEVSITELLHGKKRNGEVLGVEFVATSGLCGEGLNREDVSAVGQDDATIDCLHGEPRGGWFVVSASECVLEEVMCGS